MTHERDLAEALSNRRKKYFPDFIAIARGLVSATMATLEGGDSKSFEGEPDRHKILSELTESNIVGSEVLGSTYKHPGIFAADNNKFDKLYTGEKMHKPVLDIDLPICAEESSTEGHWHLIIDKEMPESIYFELLDAMLKANILEKGFVDAAKSRGASWIRTPWTKKVDEK